MNNKDIGKFIQDERKKLNLTQEELAKKIYVSNKAISKWETGKGIPNIEALQELANVFQVTISEILQGERNSKDVDKVITKTLKEKQKIRRINLFLTIILGFIICFLEVFLTLADVNKIIGIIIFVLFFITIAIVEYISKHE